MFNPTPVQLFAWLATMASQALLCFFLFRYPNKSFPVFRAFILAQTMLSLLAVATALQHPETYFYSYYACTISVGVLVLLSSAEIYRRVFGPRRALPRWIPEKTAVAVGVSMLAGIAFTLLMRVHVGGPWTNGLMKMEQALAIGDWCVFAILAIYSRHLCITWGKRPQGIAGAFVFYLTVNMLTVFIRSRSAAAANMAGLVEQIAYLLAVLWWCWIWRKYEPAIEGTVSDAITCHRQTLAQLRMAERIVLR